ncbi:hypothetical protein [Streptobacillus moniliformis]|uniref:HMA domain-containing protein n=1 Tax=Streptobacillus moniliformis (strain ATCC 14647 / DSM 12112 / NCTC 10651 / 9901) TaxID=519441 RepID=D1AWS3_STRM9|nr:hypothetical protein [Streptobacillus moniliformis]ACZ00749.1 hypothetical protein Smon_0264 [Streptobacillus moniliformis DSM 12112]AVL42856.1 hypothetical protein CEP89_02895 [Streptobacillus moniliformis]QXW65502.1 hypothetical protein KX935_06965 [Streptobacillus moniliformis]SQA14122.1 Uncharacterised protein [Streptobacillus moniliformis]
MKKKILLENFNEIKQVKQISTILLGLSEIEDLEADLDNSSITLSLNNFTSNEMIKYFIKSANFNVVDIIDME